MISIISRVKSIIQKRGLPLLLLAVLVIAAAAACVPQTIPTEELPSENVQESVPASETSDPSTPTAQALKEVLKSELLETPEQSVTVTPLLEEVLQLQPTSSKLDAEVQKRINYAKSDLAVTLGVETTAVEVVAYEEITWNDGSLGCPQPDMMYTQALVDGYVIQLQVDGQFYNYHGAIGRDPFLCSDDPNTSQSPPAIPRSGELATPPIQEE